MTSFRLLNYAGVAGEVRPGILVGDCVIDLETSGLRGSTYEMLQDWDTNQAKFREIAGNAASSESSPLAGVQLMAPVVPPVVYNAAANYVDHQKEMSGGTQLVKEDTKGMLEVDLQFLITKINVPRCSRVAPRTQTRQCS